MVDVIVFNNSNIFDDDYILFPVRNSDPSDS